MSRKNMLLLTVSEWIGPGRAHPSPGSVEERTRTIAFATRLTLAAAINELAAYAFIYNRQYDLAVNFSLISVSEIEDLSDASLSLANVQLIESLALSTTSSPDNPNI
jgi:hypothetical protein